MGIVLTIVGIIGFIPMIIIELIYSIPYFVPSILMPWIMLIVFLLYGKMISKKYSKQAMMYYYLCQLFSVISYIVSNQFQSGTVTGTPVFGNWEALGYGGFFAILAAICLAIFLKKR